MEFGYRYDTETGLYYLQSRYYNPEWGRFINADTSAGNFGDLLSPNLFAYCGNNPINMLDQDGYSGTWALDIGIGILEGLAAFGEDLLSASPVGWVVAAFVGTLSLTMDSYTVGDDSRHFSNSSAADNTITIANTGKTIKSKGKSKSSSNKTETFPKDPNDLDNVLGKKGKKVNDGPTTPGRNKIKWELPNNVTITHEEHPYDVNAPQFHKGPHYHVDGPGFNHDRFMPGDKIPIIFP